MILWKNKILKQPKPIDDLPTPFEDLFAYSWNGSIDSMSGFKNILQHVQVLAPELHHAHTWGYLSDLFHDECSSVLLTGQGEKNSILFLILRKAVN